jgi:hypothetical protein
LLGNYSICAKKFQFIWDLRLVMANGGDLVISLFYTIWNPEKMESRKDGKLQRLDFNERHIFRPFNVVDGVFSPYCWGY